MKKVYQKAVFAFSAVLALALTAGAVYFGKDALPEQNHEALAVFSAPEQGNISPIVRDGKTDAPIENAVICVPETGKTYQTDGHGAVGKISVPILRDDRYDAMIPKNWGEVTLLVYKGLCALRLVYLRIHKDESRTGPTIFLYAEESFNLGTPLPSSKILTTHGQRKCSKSTSLRLRGSKKKSATL